METLLQIWIYNCFRMGRHGKLLWWQTSPSQSIKAYFPFSISIVRNFEEKGTLAKAGNRMDNKIKDTGQRMWTRHM